MPTPSTSPLSANPAATGRKRDKLARSIVGWKYITPEGRVNVLQYKYRGTDHSYIYKYIGSPLAEFCVKLTPTWVAPNLITLSGLFLVILSWLAFLYYCPYLECDRDTPRWPWFLAAACLATYSVMDNMDGKQARRTGSSSPLGLLFDHGCDAFNACILSCSTQAILLQTGHSSYESLLIWTANAVGFYVATWEEFHLEELVLPWFNAPNEGIVTLVIALTLVGIFGSESRLIEFTPGWSFARGGMWFFICSSFLTEFVQVVKVIRHESTNERAWSRAVARLSPMLCIVGTVWLWAFVSPDLYDFNPRLFLFPAGFLMVDSVSKLMVSHVCHQKYRPIWVMIGLYVCTPLTVLACRAYAAAIPTPAAQLVDSVLPLFAGLPGFRTPPQSSPSLTLELIVLYSLILSTLGCLLFFIFTAIKELTTILGIYCFTITRKRPVKTE